MSEVITRDDIDEYCGAGACAVCLGEGIHEGLACKPCLGTGRVPDVEMQLRAEVARLTNEIERRIEWGGALEDDVDRLEAKVSTLEAHRWALAGALGELAETFGGWFVVCPSCGATLVCEEDVEADSPCATCACDGEHPHKEDCVLHAALVAQNNAGSGQDVESP